MPYAVGMKRPGPPPILKISLFLVLTVLFLGYAGLSPGAGAEVSGAQTGIRPDGVVEFLMPDGTVAASVHVETALTPAERSRGLMGRPLRGFGEGMLFLYSTAAPRTFWMRDTPTSLDIIFVGEDARVGKIVKGTEEMSDHLYSSKGPAKWVIEVRNGFCDLFGIKEGTRIRWSAR